MRGSPNMNMYNFLEYEMVVQFCSNIENLNINIFRTRRA